MGLYDREYARDYESGFRLSAPSTATLQLLLITVGVYIAQLLFPALTGMIELRSDWWSRPWEAYRLLTYGFAHNPNDIKHILFNMVVLGIFGNYIEQRYGRARFLFFYLSSIIIGGLVWSLICTLQGALSTVVGASGATTAIFILFAFNYPHMQIQMMFLFPMPAWVAALIGVAMDMQGAIAQYGAVAFTVHLAGAAYATYYFYYGADATRSISEKLSNLSLKSLKRRPKLRVHAPDEDDAEDSLAQQVDVILEKIQRSGKDSLTWRERRTLERASKEYQEKRR
ncbi:rhomboid family intramembrane serine protease [Lacipirellula sp.]|uniref:rhomboid family intramembrane serine protease n=1 Tax=Lacipirellula sp. TaxID=2691419 RepID=UPI003D14DB08